MLWHREGKTAPPVVTCLNVIFCHPPEYVAFSPSALAVAPSPVMTRIRSDEFPIVGLLSAFLPRILRFYISELDSEVWQAFVEAH